MELGDTVFIVSAFNKAAPKDKATVVKETNTRVTLSSGLIVDKATGRVRGEDYTNAVLATPELEVTYKSYLTEQSRARKLSIAKSDLAGYLEKMQSGYFRYLSDKQVYDCLEALKAILG